MGRPKLYTETLRCRINDDMAKAIDAAEQEYERAGRADTVRFLLRKVLRDLKLLPGRAAPRSRSRPRS